MKKLIAPRNEDLPTLKIRAVKGQEYEVPDALEDELTGRGWKSAEKPASKASKPTTTKGSEPDKKES